MLFQRTKNTNLWEKFLNTATKTGLNAAKTVSKKIFVSHKTAETTGELIGEKSAEKFRMYLM